MKKLSILLVVILTLFYSSCTYGIDKTSKVYILGIGVNYKSSNYLSGTCMDAEEFSMYYKYILDKKNIKNKLFLMLDKREIVSKDGSGSRAKYNYEEYIDENSAYVPTKQNIQQLFDTFVNGNESIEKLNANDLLIIYYSGHGNTPPSSQSTLPDGTRVTVEDSTGSETGAMILPNYETNSYVNLHHSELVSLLVSLPCQVAIISDSCHSGHLAGQISEIGEKMEDSASMVGAESDYNEFDFSKIYSSSNVSGVFAAVASEVSYADESAILEDFNKEKHSIFTGYVMSKCLNWQHERELFDTILAGVDVERGIYTPLVKNVYVYGKPASDEYTKDLKLSTSDIVKAFPKWATATSSTMGTVWISQHTIMSTGINSKLILW